MRSMSSPGDSSTAPPWRVRFGGGTYRVKDKPSLRKLVDSGKVPGHAEVQPPHGEAWLPLDQVLGGVEQETRDPWAVWDQLDDDAEVSIPPTQAEPPPRPEGASSPAEPPRPAQPAPTTAPPPPSASPRSPTDQAGPWRPQRERIEEPAPASDFSVSVTPADEEPWEEDDEEVATVDSGTPLALGSEPPTGGAPPPREPRQPPRSSTPAQPPPPVARPRQPDSPRAAPASQAGSGNVIYFPGPRGGRRDTEGPHALATSETVPFPQPETPSLPPMELGGLPPARPARARPERATGDAPVKPNWWRIGAVVVSGLIILGSVRWYVAMNATADFGAPATRPTAAAVPPGAPPVVPAPQASSGPASGVTQVTLGDGLSTEDPFQDLEQEIRSQLRVGLLPVESEAELESALLIELNHVRLDVIKVDLNVLATVGDSQVPESVEVRLRLRDRGSDLAPQLAAAALVVGKYAQHLDLAVPLLEVGFPAGEGTVRRVHIEIDAARALFLGRMELRDFLAQLSAH